MQTTLWPRGLIGRVTAVLLAAVMLEFLGATVLFEQADLYAVREDRARRLAEQLVVADRLLAGTPILQRPAAAASLSTEHVTISWSPTPLVEAERGRSLQRMAAQITSWEARLAGRDMRLDIVHRPSRRFTEDLVGAIRMRDGSWLHFHSTSMLGQWPLLYGAVFSASILALGVLMAAALIVHTLGGPLRALAHAADNVGHGEPVNVTERGSGDLRLVARAFNAMQGRIGKLIADRTETLAAVSHDLRTPLSRMRLRLGFVPDSETRDAIEADIGEMEAMLDSVLAYLAGETDPEPAKLTDLAAMTMTLVDAATDAGAEASYDGPDHLPLSCRALAVKRALGNLIENAIKYGACAHVRLEERAGEVRFSVEDTGPGIPEEELAGICTPFRRLDAARARNTAGLGLGLSIVAKVVEREGATLNLINMPKGGLRAEIIFRRIVRSVA